MDIRAKGELGLRLTWMATLAFVLCILGQTLLLGLFLALVLVKERNEWLSRQVLAAFLLGIVESLLGVVGSAVSFLGSMNTPLAMVIIGAQMAAADWRAVFRSPAILLACVLKLAAMPLLTALILYPLHPELELYCTLVLLAGVPTASVTAMFAQRYGQDVATSAQLVTVSTLLSILTLPCCGVLAALLSGAV